MSSKSKPIQLELPFGAKKSHNNVIPFPKAGTRTKIKKKELERKVKMWVNYSQSLDW